MKSILLLVAPLIFCFGFACSTHFDPTWESLDKHVAPAWYDEAKFGIFMHWGVYSVPGMGEWFWEHWKRRHTPSAVKFMKDNYPPNFQYQDFAHQWKAEFFNASKWADLIQASGAKYYVVTSKHHEGFTLWRSNVSWNWNAVDAGPHRDIVGQLAEAIRSRTDVHFGLYHSLLEWFHPLYILDQENKGKTQEFVKMVTMPQLKDIVNKYRPEYIWSDGDWSGTPEYWMSKEFLAWLYSDSPVRDNILVNDRWGIGVGCKHGDVKNCQDSFTPAKKLAFKWEDAMPLDKQSWGYRRQMNAEDVHNITDIVSILIQTVSMGGNLLLNVGPTPYGTIAPIFEERLNQIGSWLKVNGDAIYSTKPWRIQNDTESEKIWFTSKGEIVFALLLEWPSDGIVILHHVTPTESTIVYMNGVADKLPWTGKIGQAGLQVNVSNVKQPCEWAWSLAMTNVE